ncbi:caspase, EACC1-associated type [Nocardia sp. FBN12]|uniref:caspase, EACC1-associated type n=1 Tax=Nocardia sp. FBN12 TaxID=3419766 RepID=UPI003D055EB9
MPDALDGDYSGSQAVLVGTWDYSELEQIPAAQHSLRRMASLLTSDLCGWPSERVTLVENQRMVGELPDLLVRKFNQAEDVALFYFVGHGQQDAYDQLCLALGNTSRKAHRRQTTSLAYSQVRHAFQMSPARMKIALLDCCFAGLAVNQNGTLAVDAKVPTAPGAYLMMATGPYSTAWFQFGAEHETPQTFFTKAVVDVVESGVSRAGRGLTLDILFQEAANRLVFDGKPQPDHNSTGFSHTFHFARNIITPSSLSATPTKSILADIPEEPAEQRRPILTRAGSRKKRLSSSRRDIGAFTESSAREMAYRHGIRLGTADAPGVRIGTIIPGKVPAYSSYFDSQLWICGPRRGISASTIVPALVEAIGPVIFTSTKGDEVALTRNVREGQGSRVYVFDPHDLVNERPTWFWNPLDWVDVSRSGAENRAARLAGYFSHSADGIDVHKDASVAAQSEDVLANLFLAAAVRDEPITLVWEWLTDPINSEPVVNLRTADMHAAVNALAHHYNSDYRARERIFAGAMQMARCLRMPELHRWITRSENTVRFDELEFIEQNFTLMALSAAGRGTGAPIVSALVGAILDEASKKAARSVGSSLPIPLIAILDDAPQLLRWPDFPRVYAGLGQRGIVAIAIMQSWEHGVQGWGASGMADVWSAAALRCIGGGLPNIEFARAHFEALGFPAVPGARRSGLGGVFGLGRGRTEFSISDLLTLQRGEVVVLPQTGSPLLVRTTPWWEGAYRDAIRQSIEYESPRSRVPLAAIPQSGTTLGSTSANDEIRPL